MVHMDMVVRPEFVSRLPSGLISAFQLPYYRALFGEKVEPVQSLPPLLSLFFTFLLPHTVPFQASSCFGILFGRREMDAYTLLTGTLYLL
jgi:hypothetical protein